MLFFNRPVADSVEKPEPASVRRFLIELYGRDELEMLCADYFRDVYVEIEGTALTKSALAQKLIDHCHRHGRKEQLWAALQKTRPEAFSQQFSQYSRQVPEPHCRVRDPHRVFISYAHPDRQLARRLAADLHAHGFGVWLAPDSIHPGESWVSAIDRGLQECGVFLAVLSPGALKSQWVKSETRVAIQLEHQGKLRLIPVLAKPCDPTKLSSFLASYQVVPLSRSYDRGLENVLAELGGAPEPEPVDAPLAEAATPAISIARPVDAAPVHVPASARLSLTEPVRMDLIRIPAGSFWMGSHLKRDPHANANERPRHRVRLSEYFIAKHSVTNEQYAVFARAMQRDFKLPVGKASHPVVNVSWDDAQSFCAWLTSATGRRFMLPSEAEWEKAARGTDGRIYPWGDAFDAARLNSCEAGPPDTVPVGHFSPRGDSPYGVADLCGNVWEWCDDWFADEAYAQRARSKVVDPLGPPQGNLRALRGGAFDFDRLAVRCAYREGAPPYERSYDYGFRVVMRP